MESVQEKEKKTDRDRGTLEEGRVTDKKEVEQEKIDSSIKSVPFHPLFHLSQRREKGLFAMKP